MEGREDTDDTGHHSQPLIRAPGDNSKADMMVSTQKPLLHFLLLIEPHSIWLAMRHTLGSESKPFMVAILGSSLGIYLNGPRKGNRPPSSGQ